MENADDETNRRMIRTHCIIAGCLRVHVARGMCKSHYYKWRKREGQVVIERERLHTPDERFWAKVEKTDTCWLWTGCLSGVGYGQIRIHTKCHLAHRYSFELHKHQIPAGLVLDHLCRNRRCVNPDHLEPVTRHENIRRGTAWTVKRNRTCCPRGHEFTPENSAINQKGVRRCRTCIRRSQYAYVQRRKEGRLHESRPE